jgi:hypothetical protein
VNSAIFSSLQPRRIPEIIAQALEALANVKSS